MIMEKSVASSLPSVQYPHKYENIHLFFLSLRGIVIVGATTCKIPQRMYSNGEQTKQRGILFFTPVSLTLVTVSLGCQVCQSPNVVSVAPNQVRLVREHQYFSQSDI